MKDQFISESHQNVTALKEFPVLSKQRIMLKVGLICLASWIGLIIIAFVVRFNYHITLFYIPFLLASPNIPLVFILAFTFSPLLQRNKYRKIEQKRQRYARGEKLPIADQQLQPDPLAYTLPLTIRYKPNWMTVVIIWGISIIVFIILLVVNRWLSFSMYELTFFTIFFFIVCLSSVLGAIFQGGKQLIADEMGLTMKFGLPVKPQSIPWSEARLFAIDMCSKTGNKKSKQAYQLELASQQEVICWQDSMQIVPVEMLVSKPALANEEYARQLQALRAVIAEKTSLPLSDLSK